jgi:hypothetical protein
MDVLIYLRGDLDCGRDQLEDALEEAFGGHGEVVGGGLGGAGSNIDLSISDGSIDVATALRIIRAALKPFALPFNSVVVIDKEYPLFDNLGR